MLRLNQKSVSVLERSYHIFVLILLTLFLVLPSKAFALQQLTNPDFTNGTTGWTLTYRVQGTNGYNSEITTQNNNLRIYGNNTSNRTRYIDGLASQRFTTPASPINVRFDWGNWSVTGGSSNYNLWLGYSTVEAGITSPNYLDRRTQKGNYNGSSSLITTFTTDTNYYAKIYTYVSLNRNTNYTALFDSLSVNFSPSGLAGEAISNGISLSWNTSTSNAVTLSKYYIYRSTTSGSGYNKIAEVNAGTTTYIDSSVSGGNTYYYVITDLDSLYRLRR